MMLVQSEKPLRVMGSIEDDKGRFFVRQSEYWLIDFHQNAYSSDVLPHFRLFHVLHVDRNDVHPS